MQTDSKQLMQHAGRGQGLVEYALVLVLGAIVLIMILGATGGAIGNVFSTIVNDMVENPAGRTSAYDSHGLPSDGAGDTDGDGIPDSSDNCPTVPNPGQADFDGDGTGDHCDDSDGDGILDAYDPCPQDAANTCAAAGGGGGGSILDSDGDGVPDSVDNCPAVPNTDQIDTDGDGMGNACDADDDNDGIPDSADNCPLMVNPAQTDTDGDGIGDTCDPDNDNDGVLDHLDNCPLIPNPGQENQDKDLWGDVCDDDADNDGIPNHLDACPDDPYHDTIGDPCNHDEDNDGYMDDSDPCPFNEGIWCGQFQCSEFGVGAIMQSSTTNAATISLVNFSEEPVIIQRMVFNYNRQNSNTGIMSVSVGSTVLYSVTDGAEGHAPLVLSNQAISIPTSGEPPITVTFEHGGDRLESVRLEIGNGFECTYTVTRFAGDGGDGTEEGGDTGSEPFVCSHLRLGSIVNGMSIAVTNYGSETVVVEQITVNFTRQNSQSGLLRVKLEPYIVWDSGPAASPVVVGGQSLSIAPAAASSIVLTFDHSHDAVTSVSVALSSHDCTYTVTP